MGKSAGRGAWNGWGRPGPRALGKDPKPHAGPKCKALTRSREERGRPFPPAPGGPAALACAPAWPPTPLPVTAPGPCTSEGGCGHWKARPVGGQVRRLGRPRSRSRTQVAGAGWDSTNRSSPPSSSHPEDLPQTLLRFFIDPPQSNFCLEYPWIIGNWRWGGPSSLSSGALRLAAPPPPYSRLGLPTPHSPSQEQAPLGESPRAECACLFKRPRGAPRGPPGAGGGGHRRGRLAPGGRGSTTKLRPLSLRIGRDRQTGGGRALSSPSLSQAVLGGGVGRALVPGPFRVVRTLSFPQQPNQAPAAWPG
ncbi:hypothetical protein NN561_003132 [Cricetulus griseus]